MRDLAKVGTTSSSISPLRFFVQLNEAACLAIERSIEADEDGNDFRFEHFRRVSEEILECLHACLTSNQCDLALIYAYSRSEVRKAQDRAPQACMKRALKAIQGIHGLWTELGVIDTAMVAAA